MARHAGVELGTGDWMEHGYDIPLLVNMQPAGEYLSERFHRAGGVPAVMWELLQAGKLDGSALTCTGRSQAENLEGREATDRDVIYPYSAPLKERSGFLVLSGNLFDFAIMKTSVIGDEFRQRYLSRPGHEGAFEGRAIVFDGSDDYHHRINDPSLDIDENCILVIRGSGPIGWPGSAEVVNMQPPDALLQRGITSLPTLGDGRQSGRRTAPRSSTLRRRVPREVGSNGSGQAISFASISTPAPAMRSSTLKKSRAARANLRRRFRRATRRGKSYSARRRASYRPAERWNLRSSIAAPRTRCRGTITEPGFRKPAQAACPGRKG